MGKDVLGPLKIVDFIHMNYHFEIEKYVIHLNVNSLDAWKSVLRPKSGAVLNFQDWFEFKNTYLERKKDPEESDDDRLLLEEIERALCDELTAEEILGLGVKIDKLETQMVSQNGKFELTKPLRKGSTRWYQKFAPRR